MKVCSSSFKNMKIHFFRMSWLFRTEQVIMPSIYMQQKLSSSQRAGMVRGRVYEASRLRNNLQTKLSAKILPYFWYKYQDYRDTFLDLVYHMDSLKKKLSLRWVFDFLMKFFGEKKSYEIFIATDFCIQFLDISIHEIFENLWNFWNSMKNCTILKKFDEFLKFLICYIFNF